MEMQTHGSLKWWVNKLLWVDVLIDPESRRDWRQIRNAKLLFVLESVSGNVYRDVT